MHVHHHHRTRRSRLTAIATVAASRRIAVVCTLYNTSILVVHVVHERCRTLERGFWIYRVLLTTCIPVRWELASAAVVHRLIPISPSIKETRSTWPLNDHHYGLPKHHSNKQMPQRVRSGFANSVQREAQAAESKTRDDDFRWPHADPKHICTTHDGA